MSLIRWDPFRELNTTAWNPSVDIFENDNEVIIKAKLPGMEAKDIDVKLENNVLTLKGERRFEKETKDENYKAVELRYLVFTRQLIRENSGFPTMLQHSGMLLLFHCHFDPEPSHFEGVGEANGKVQIQLGRAFFETNETFVDLCSVHRTTPPAGYMHEVFHGRARADIGLGGFMKVLIATDGSRDRRGVCFNGFWFLSISRRNL